MLIQNRTLLRLRLGVIAITAVASFFFNGCSSPQSSAPRARLFFPKSPSAPKIEFIDAYSSQQDFPRSPFKAFVDKIFGGDVPNVFVRPFDIASNGKGKVYISDIYKPGLYIYDLAGHSMRVVDGKLLGYVPMGLAVDRSGNVYITDTRNNMVHVYDESERFLFTIRDELNWPTGIAIDEANSKRIVVANSHGHNITVYDSKGRYVSSVGTRGSNDGEFNFPVDVAVSRSGKIVVADAMNARVQVLTADGKFENKFGTRGDTPSSFGTIKGIAVDSDDNIYITDGSALNIKVYDMSGNYLLTFGGSYTARGAKIAPGGFAMPSGIDVDDKNGIFVADQVNKLFQVFQYLDKAYLDKHPIEK